MAGFSSDFNCNEFVNDDGENTRSGDFVVGIVRVIQEMFGSHDEPSVLQNLQSFVGSLEVGRNVHLFAKPF